MPKIIYQYMMEPSLNNWLQQKKKQYRHKTLSQTMNYIFRGIIQVEQLEANKKQEKKPEKKKKTSSLDQLADKYGIEGYD